MKYIDLLKKNRELGKEFKTSVYSIAVLSNITINLIKEILEYTLRKEGINADVQIENYNNIIQDSTKCKNANLVIIFWELCNFFDGLPHKIELFNDDQIESLFKKIQLEIDLVFRNLQDNSLVLLNRLTALSFNNSNSRINNFKKLANNINQYIECKLPENIKFIEMDEIIAQIGVNQSISWRNYYASKSLYTNNFFREYSESIKPFVMSINGKSKKAIIFDCDNTLWKGILGEDGLNHIEMSPQTKDGLIFSEIQNIALSLSKQGVLIGLCSKNNAEDVEEVINSHHDMQLRAEQITIKKVNWNDKVTNLKEIANELNISLDSILFIDDSPFEINFIKENLPEVTVLQVPERLYEYPSLFRTHLGRFFELSLTAEDGKKVEIYKQQEERASAKQSFENIDDYLGSLKLKLDLFEDDENFIARMAQMTQKTNQFNLTTQRYTETDIRKFIKDQNSNAFACNVSDIYGDHGITGLTIIHYDHERLSATIDTFLLSCRIIGRNIEFALMDYLIKIFKQKNIKQVCARYIQTRKNELVANFYDNSSFYSETTTESEKTYVMDTYKYKPNLINYIEVNDGRQN